jgi:hypothetical protein
MLSLLDADTSAYVHRSGPATAPAPHQPCGPSTFHNREFNPTMPGIFISYRRKDQPGFAGRIYDRLQKHFGGVGIFMDDRTINPGQRFDLAIANKILSSDVTLVIIGDRWNDNNRLNDPDDWVRREIVESLKQPDRTIPILLDDAALMKSDFPLDLQPLAFANTVKINHVGFEGDVASLVSYLRKRLRLWDEATFLAEAADNSIETATKLKAIFYWAAHRGFQLAWGRDQSGSFWLQPLGGNRTVFMSSSKGASQIYLPMMKELRYLKDEEACRNFIKEMNDISNLHIPSDRAATASFGFQLSNIGSINHFIDLLDRTLQRSSP